MKKPENITNQDWQLLCQKYKKLEPIVKKINDNYPVQYLIGNVDFYGYLINVNENVLIPRFETEGLVEKTLNYINKMGLNKASVLEVGTGSGCISVALKCEIPKLEITAIDISNKALLVAKKNAKNNKANINFIHKDVFKFNLVNDYDVIISNPPYISEGDEVGVSTKFEPHNAIYAPDNPLEYYDQILRVGSNVLNKKHLIAFEIDELQAENMKKLAKSYFPNDKYKIEKDLAGKYRYMFIFSK